MGDNVKYYKMSFETAHLEKCSVRSKPVCLEWAVNLACGGAGCRFLSETLKGTCSNWAAASEDWLEDSVNRTMMCRTMMCNSAAAQRAARLFCSVKLDSACSRPGESAVSVVKVLFSIIYNCIDEHWSPVYSMFIDNKHVVCTNRIKSDKCEADKMIGSWDTVSTSSQKDLSGNSRQINLPVSTNERHSAQNW